MKRYQHTQPATNILISLIVVFIVFAVMSIFIHPMIPGTILLLITAWIFRSLTIEITDSHLNWFFGSGFPRKSVPLSEIASVDPIRTGFWNGWGIHYTPRGWLYNVSGYGAVAIRMRNGKQFCLGTDQSEELAGQLAAASSKGL